MGRNTIEGTGGLKLGGDSKGQIQENCSLEGVVKHSRVEVEDMASRSKNGATAKYVQSLKYHQQQ